MGLIISCLFKENMFKVILKRQTILERNTIIKNSVCFVVACFGNLGLGASSCGWITSRKSNRVLKTRETSLYNPLKKKKEKKNRSPGI